MKNLASRVVLLSAALTALPWVSEPLHAAKPLGTTSSEVIKGHITIAVGKAIEKEADHRVRFAFSDSLYGTAPEHESLSMQPETHAWIQRGHAYLVAYSPLRKNQLLRKGLEPHPNGPTIIATTLAGDFVLEDSPAVRQLILGPLGKGAAIAEQAEATFAALECDDTGAVRFATMELYGRQDLRDAVDDAMMKRWAALLHADGVDPIAQEFLYRAALRLPATTQRDWIAEAGRDLLSNLELPLDPGSPLPQLSIITMDAIAKTGTKEDVSQITSFLEARHPGIAKGALAAMDQLDPAGTIERARTWLAKDDLLDETRRVLRAYLDRHEE